MTDVFRIWIDREPPAGVTVPSDVELVGSPEAADGVVVGSEEPWDTEACLRYPDLKVVARCGIGYDNLNLDECAAQGVAACNAPDAPTVSTAEHALALMLAVTKSIRITSGRLEAGIGDYRAVNRAIELDGLTLGLLGCGRIGSRLAGYGIAIGMRVIVCDPYLDRSEHESVDLDHLWAESDVISLHAPATPETHHIVNFASIEKMRKGVVIVNCARGALLDQAALLAGLDSGRIAGAGLDVTDPEPLPVGHPLLGRDDVIVTPHVASSTTVGMVRLIDHALDQAIQWLRGGTPERLLNPAVLDNSSDRRLRSPEAS